jgi:hypothetical protein
MLRILFRIAAGFILALAVAYAADWIVWRMRGAGTEDVSVSKVSVASLKRNREEYYFDGDTTFTCARSLLPPVTAQGWLTPCWYLRRYPTLETHF